MNMLNNLKDKIDDAKDSISEKLGLAKHIAPYALAVATIL